MNKLTFETIFDFAPLITNCASDHFRKMKSFNKMAAIEIIGEKQKVDFNKKPQDLLRYIIVKLKMLTQISKYDRIVGRKLLVAFNIALSASVRKKRLERTSMTFRKKRPC